MSVLSAGDPVAEGSGSRASAGSGGSGSIPSNIPLPINARPTHFPITTHLSQSTFAFITSWRGQLLICVVSLALGVVYVVVRDPIRAWSTSRRERLSRARGEELMSMEAEESEAAKRDKRDNGRADGEDVSEGKEKRGRDKRKKKAMGNHLRIPALTSDDGGASSTDGSPVPPSISSVSPSPAKRRVSSARSTLTDVQEISRSARSPYTKGSDLPVSSNGHANGSARPPDPSPPSLIVRPTTPQTPLSPWNVPLPDSPFAGPSQRAPSVAGSDIASLDGGDTSESMSTRARALSTDRLSNGGGFSIIPEAGYLPPTTTAPSSKKKKRRGKAIPPPPLDKDKLDTPSHNGQGEGGSARLSGPSKSPFAGFASGSGLGAIDSAGTPRTPSTSRHARKASLTRPVGADLEDLLTEREKMIDALRGDIGVAKAEEAKAREEAGQKREEGERTAAELERVKRAGHKADQEGKKREADLAARLSQISSQYTATLHRLGALENFVRESGLQPPSTLPTIPAGPILPSVPAPGSALPVSSPAPTHIASPSPYNMSFNPASPHTPAHPQGHAQQGMVYSPYWSPGMYPSPMLHPHYSHNPALQIGHAHQSPVRDMSPASYRRASTAGGEDPTALAGSAAQPTLNAYAYVNGVSPHSGQPSPGLPTQYHPGTPSITAGGSGSPMVPNGMYVETGNPNGLSPSDLRRISIQDSVMKKKPDHGSRASRSGSTSISTSASSTGSGSQRGEGQEDSEAPSAAVTIEVQGLGVGAITRPNVSSSITEEGEQDAGSSGSPRPTSRSGSGYEEGPSSPSPPHRGSIPLTPSSADLFQRSLSRGSDSGSHQGSAPGVHGGSNGDALGPIIAGSSSASSSDLAHLHSNGHLMPVVCQGCEGCHGSNGVNGVNGINGVNGVNGIKVISEGENGNIYYASNGGQPDSDSDHDHDHSHGHPYTDDHGEGNNEHTIRISGHSRSRPSLDHPRTSTDTNGHSEDVDRVENGAAGEEYQPMFASLAHTPAQLAEIQRMRELALSKSKSPRVQQGVLNGHGNGVVSPRSTTDGF